MGRACGWYGRQDGCIQSFGGGDLRNGVHLEVPDLDGRKILKWVFKKWDGGAWIGLMWFRIGTG
jgi:hypothetical protein